MARLERGSEVLWPAQLCGLQRELGTLLQELE